MLGTAFPAARLLLVEQPGPWGARVCATRASTPRSPPRWSSGPARPACGCSPSAAPAARPRGRARRWALVDTRDGHESLRWGDVRHDAELLDLPLDGRPATRTTADLPGLRAQQARHLLRAARPAGGGRPRRSCARAGCGSAATSAATGSRRTCSCCPAGCCTAGCCRSPPPEFVAAAEGGEVVGALLRGRVGLRAGAQAALAFAYEHLRLRAGARPCAWCAARRSSNGAAVVRIWPGRTACST